MGVETKIQWTDATWNPIIGCSRVSEGCRNCYAETIAGRFGAGKETVYSGLTQIVNGRSVWSGKITETKQLLDPLKWKPGRPIYDAQTGKKVGRDTSQSLRIFVNSMSDLFHENVTDEQRDRIFAVMALCPQHTFQVLTKRPERMLEYITKNMISHDVAMAVCELVKNGPVMVIHAANIYSDWLEERFPDDVGFIREWPLPNVWLGVSVENQKAAKARIPLLLQTPAAVRFISAEPLLGPVNLDGDNLDDLHALGCGGGESCHCGTPKLDWVICGGESGPHARPMHPAWARNLRDQCHDAGVPFFFKQWGEWTPGECVDAVTGTVQTATWIGDHWVIDREKLESDEGHIDDEPDLYRVGKKAAGAFLDGREWTEFPTAHQDGGENGDFSQSG